MNLIETARIARRPTVVLSERPKMVLVVFLQQPPDDKLRRALVVLHNVLDAFLEAVGGGVGCTSRRSTRPPNCKVSTIGAVRA